MTFLYALRYFRIVPVVPPYLIAALAVAVIAAAVRLMTNPSAAVDALTPVLCLQLFVASSGFRVGARRGYYDLLLTSATPRWQIAVAHCLVSIVPGIIGWLCVGVLELVASRGSHFASGSAGTCAAFAVASLVAWGTAVFASRMAVAAWWLLLMTIPPLASVVSPVHLLGRTTATPDGVALSVGCTAALISLTAGVASIVRGTVPLEASQ